MGTVALAAAAFLCACTGAAIGLLIRGRLPAHHLSRDSTDVIKLATGLMATLVALVLSLLISSANSFRNQVENEYKQALANVAQLDQRLRAYGPETTEARDLLRRIVVTGARQRWPQEDFGAAPGVDRPIPAALLDLERRILRLRPTDEEQKWFQSQSLQLLSSLTQIQRMVSSQERSSTLPIPVLIVVIMCSAAIFTSFGLFAEPNPTVVAALTFAALAVAGAVFLIIELSTPFSGLLQLPGTPMKILVTVLDA